MQSSFDAPHTLVFAVAAVLFLLLPVTTMGSDRSLTTQRKVYWGATFGSVVCVVIAFLPNIAAGLTFGLLAVFITTIRAYFTTQYIKIGRRVIAFHSPPELSKRRRGSSDSRGGQPYSPTVSAAKMWWLMVFGVGVLGGFNMWTFVVDHDDVRAGLLGLGITMATGALFGVGDSKWRQEVARGQLLPFAIISAATAGIFAVSYLPAFWLTLRLRRHRPAPATGTNNSTPT